MNTTVFWAVLSWLQAGLLVAFYARSLHPEGVPLAVYISIVVMGWFSVVITIVVNMFEWRI